MPEQSKTREDAVSEKLYESIKFVADLTSRIDERVKTIIEQQEMYEEKLERLIDTQSNLLSRVSVLESKNGHRYQADIDEIRRTMHKNEIKIAALEIHSARHEGKWSMISDLVVRLLWTIAALVIIYKMGLSTLPLP